MQQCVKSTTGNVIISPFSVANSLALLSQATDGSTFDELKKGLHLNVDKSTIANQFPEYYKQLQNGAGSSIFSIANQVYVQQGYAIKKNFQEVAVQKFLSSIESIDFSKKNEAAARINQLVKEKTYNKITDLIKPDMLGADSRVILINAIYFKGDWERKFNEQFTAKDDFYISETEKVKVDFMYMSNSFNYAFLDDLEASALELKYANSNFSFVIVRPNSRTGLSALETKLNNYNLTAITEKMEYDEIDIWIPKFKAEYEVKLNDALKNVGYWEIFYKFFFPLIKLIFCFLCLVGHSRIIYRKCQIEWTIRNK